MTADLAELKRDWPLFRQVTGIEKPGPHRHCFNADGHKHNDRSGSLSVSIGEEGAIVYSCKGCGAQGTVVDAFALLHGVTATEAIKQLTVSNAQKPASTPRPAPPQPKPATFPTLDALRDSLRRQGWTIAAEFPYHDGHGQEVFRQIRIERAEERKQFRPARPVAGGFEMSLPEGPRPLYALPELLARPSEQVLVLEGERKADCARKHGFLATCSAGGSNGAAKSDWSPMKGRDVLISPNNDDAGRKYAEEVRELVMQAGARSCRIVALPGLPEKGDIVDFVATLDTEGKTREEAAASIKALLRWDERSPDMRQGPRTLREWLECPELRKVAPRLGSGFPDLDAALDGGLVSGGLYVVAGDTGAGKSTLVLNLARRAALDGTEVLLVTLEDRPLQIVRKLLSASAHVPVRCIEKLKFTTEQGEHLRGAKHTLLDLPFTIDGDTAALDALALLLSASAQQGCKLAVVDQMSWIAAPGQTPFERAAAISRRMKAIARDTGLVLVLVCQVNRTGARLEGGPGLHDLRDSGTIEQDADGVLIIKGVDEYLGGRPAIMNLCVEKHRHGPKGKQFHFSWFQAEALIESYMPADVTRGRV